MEIRWGLRLVGQRGSGDVTLHQDPSMKRRPCPPARFSPSMSETATIQQWICMSCGFIYDPEEGDPDGGIPPGTAFEDIPGDWFCPVCGARKKDFELYDG